MKCDFCEDPSIKGRIIVENGDAMAFLSFMPIVIGHGLIIPKRHVQTFEGLTQAEQQGMKSLLLVVKKVLQKTFQADGFNYAWNEGEKAGQSVPHLHLHILPRKEGDSGVYEYEPRQYLYRPGTRAVLPDNELGKVVEQIRANL